MPKVGYNKEKLLQMNPFDLLMYWIRERESIRIAKDQDKPRNTWTNDPIFKQWRFCNVHRNFDRVSKWIHKEWLTKLDRAKHLWIACLLSRLVNQPSTLAQFSLPEMDNMSRYLKACQRKMHQITKLEEKKAKKDRKPVWNSAYIVSTNGRAMNKIDYVFQEVLQPAWKSRNDIEDLSGGSCYVASRQLCSLNGIQTFMAGQVIADWKYFTAIKPHDFERFAVPGPGSKKGLNIICKRPIDQSWKPKDWGNRFDKLLMQVNKSYKITGQDLQNCLCELSKYHKALHGYGSGRLKSKYEPYGEKK